MSKHERPEGAPVREVAERTELTPIEEKQKTATGLRSLLKKFENRTANLQTMLAKLQKRLRGETEPEASSPEEKQEVRIQTIQAKILEEASKVVWVVKTVF